MTNLLQGLATGLLLGGVYAVVSIGLALILGVLGVLNVALGEFMMLGMFMAVMAHDRIGLPFYVTALLALPLFWLLGVLTQVTLLENPSIRSRNDRQLVVTLGLALILQTAALLIWGPTPRFVRTDLSVKAIHLGDIFINEARLLVFVLAIIAVVALWQLLERTDLGRAMRAVADHADVASIMGIDVSKVRRITHGLGVALAGFAGALISSYYPTQPYVGIDFLTVMFVAVIIGGMGSIPGALIGAFVAGIIQVLAGLYVSLQLPIAILFALLLCLLYVRPQGILGARKRAV